MTAAAAHLLAIETSTRTARVAVLEVASGAVRAVREATADRHSSNLLPLVAEALDEAAPGARAGQLAAIACGAGPGSFTGLRVGLAAAKGLALPGDLPLVMVSSLESLAVDMLAEAAPGELLVPCLDGGKGEIFAALFAAGSSSGAVVRRAADLAAAPVALPAALAAADPSAAPPARLALAGPGAERYHVALVDEVLAGRARRLTVPGPTAIALGRLALARLARGDTDDLARAVPSYGRAPDITQPKPPTR